MQLEIILLEGGYCYREASIREEGQLSYRHRIHSGTDGTKQESSKETKLLHLKGVPSQEKIVI